MEIKKILTAVLLFLMFFQSCKDEKPNMKDLIGTWASADGAILQINSDSSFSGEMLPAEYFSFFTSKEQVQGKKINGTGKWKVENGAGFKELKLDFDKMNDKEVHGFYSVLISGEKGVTENKPPWYLFVWKDEEGGDRYKFIKKQ